METDISTRRLGITECLSSQFLDQSDGYDFSSLYSSIFPPNPQLYSLEPSDYSTDENTAPTTSPVVVDYTQSLDLLPYTVQSRFLAENKVLIERRNWCFSHLRETAKEADVLRQENINLQMANIELNKQLRLLLLQNCSTAPPDYLPPSTLSSSVIDGFRQMRISGKKPANERYALNEVPDESQTSMFEKEREQRIDVDRVALPKSISVRSNGYIKTIQAGESSGARVRAPNQPKSVKGSKVYVHGGKEQPLELQVYNQGMTKTELCNKWQQTGACPYGNHCQFAHGVHELRPVLRHPRYKTEVCRMVLNGDPCPYGHRCHFRHSLTEEEKDMGRIKRRSFKMDR
ncbi:hypothetical protein LguiB_025161 [Lonicera macranthoides]